MTATQSLGFQVIPHTPYSPDLAPCDIFLFLKFKEHLKGKNLILTRKLMLKLNDCSMLKPKTFIWTAFLKTSKSLAKMYRSKGSYVNK